MDWWITGAIGLLCSAGLVTLLSVNERLFWAQLGWLVSAVIVYFALSLIDWRPLATHRSLIVSIYIVSIFLLVATYFFAPEIRNVRSWLVIGSVHIQTAEFAAFALVIVLSYFFAHRHVAIGQWQTIAVSGAYLVAPMALVLLQPDMGSALILIGVWVGYLLASGVRRKHVVIGLVMVAVLSWWGWHSFLKDYQRERVIALFQPDYDPLGINYNTIQSKIAIGSAGWWGKGFGQGTQVQLGFLPESATDFVFAAFTEEWGLIGAILILIAYVVLVLRIVRIGMMGESNFAKLLSFGTVAVFLLHFVFSIGSTIGLIPVVGLPSPFFSYGGSSLLTNAMLAGIIQSIVIRFSF